MNVSDALLNNAWALFLLVGLVLLAIGRPRKFRVEDGRAVAESIRLPFLWAGFAVLALGGVFGLILAITLGNVAGVVMSVIQLGIYVYAAIVLARIPRQLTVTGR